MIEQKNISEKMSKDIDEMESMLNDYLQFAKTQRKKKLLKLIYLIYLMKSKKFQ